MYAWHAVLHGFEHGTRMQLGLKQGVWGPRDCMMTTSPYLLSADLQLAAQLLVAAGKCIELGLHHAQLHTGHTAAGHHA
jgi:hypothetical protein